MSLVTLESKSLVDWWIQNKDKKLDEISEITQVLNGKHRTVFLCSLAPNRVIKIEGNEVGSQAIQGALELVKKCRDVAKRHGLFRCKVPEMEVFPIDEKSCMWIEERLAGESVALAAKDKSEVEFADPQHKEKWEEIFTQAATMIAETGYYDVDWRNLLLLKDAVGFVDFESIRDPNSDNTGNGLMRLCAIAPPNAVPLIFKVARAYNLEKHMFTYQKYSVNPCFSEIEVIALRVKQLAFNQKIRDFQNENGVVEVAQKKQIPDNYAPESPEYQIIEQFNAAINEKALDGYIGGSMVDSRKLLICANHFPVIGKQIDDEISKQHAEFRQENKRPSVNEQNCVAAPFIAEIIKVVEKLKVDKVIAEWKQKVKFQHYINDFELYF